MAQPPTPDDMQQLSFWVSNWHWFTGGLFSLFGIVAIIRKGKNDTVSIIPLSEKHIDNKMTMCAGDLKEEIREEFKEDLKAMKEDMLSRIELMIKAAKNEK